MSIKYVFLVVNLFLNEHSLNSNSKAVTTFLQTLSTLRVLCNMADFWTLATDMDQRGN